MEVETEWVCLVISPYHWMGSQNEINPRPKYGENGEVHLAPVSTAIFSLHGSHRCPFTIPLQGIADPIQKIDRFQFTVLVTMGFTWFLKSCLDRQTPTALIVRVPAKPGTLYFESDLV